MHAYGSSDPSTVGDVDLHRANAVIDSADQMAIKSVGRCRQCKSAPGWMWRSQRRFGHSSWPVRPATVSFGRRPAQKATVIKYESSIPLTGRSGMRGGSPEWSIELALSVLGVIKLSVVSIPELGMRWRAIRGGGAYERGVSLQEARRIRVSDRSSLADARVDIWAPETTSYDVALRDGLRRFGGGQASGSPNSNREVPNGAVLVAVGELEGFVLWGGGIWDVAA